MAVGRGFLWIVALSTGLGWAGSHAAAELVARADLGTRVKFAILVDNVMQAHAGWVSREWMVREAAGAGFNVLCARRGFDRPDEVREVAGWCRAHGIYSMPWMRATLAAPEGPEADGERLVWASGTEQSLWSPNSDAFWEWIRRHVVEYARVASENPHLIGVFMDFENYAPGREGNAYSLSYDEEILGRFARAKGLEIPALDPAARRDWLEARRLHGEFSAFQVDLWRGRCRRLREEVDRWDPSFQFCVYPAPGTPFIREAVYPEWATDRAPLILADASTYGRPSRFMPERRALEENRLVLTGRMMEARSLDVPLFYLGGIDPLVRDADPEFSGKNAVMISEIADGYWVFYEGPTYGEEDHAAYWEWLRWANRTVADGDSGAYDRARKTPEVWELKVFRRRTDVSRLAPPQTAGGSVVYPTVRLRHENLLVVSAREGEEVEIELANVPYADYRSDLYWQLRSPDRKTLTSGTVAHGASGAIRFTPPVDGIYLLGVSAGLGTYALERANTAVGLYAGGGLSLIFSAERLYFWVPGGGENFTLTARGEGVETVRLNVRDSIGRLAASAQTSVRSDKVELRVSTEGRAEGIWSVEVTDADEGVPGDRAIAVDAGASPVVSLAPEHVFALEPGP